MAAHVLRHSSKTRSLCSLTESLELALDATQQIYFDLKPSLCTLQSISVQDPAQVIQQKQMIPDNSDETLCAGMPVPKEEWIEHSQKKIIIISPLVGKT